MKHLITFTVLFFCTIHVNAQRGQAIYAELLGAGIVYTVNFDTRFSESEDKLGGRIGVSLFNDAMIIPTQLNYLLGANSHKLEIGAGITTVLGFGSNNGDNGVAPSGVLMYRFQKQDGHFLFRIGFSPTFIPIEDDELYGDIGKIFWVWPGLSVGYKF